ncbi:nucleolar protein 10, putative (NOL10) [Plasmodium ovale curtisi]|uniref:Nucleolar protein 10, putative (NOL10) n=1 Tax=Plasmodium ovale curtisi TaxID=864141 RepID=A0A1A8VP67_PLAOA|nr:nucleolar protein 10, putative (NOL10) [Plasmodium ovale curtisi]SBS92608.1 nucleolar protein 10, putative (NOL10) [Plasmodium ovale curtisi]
MIKSFINNGIKIYSLTSGKCNPSNYACGKSTASAKKKKNSGGNSVNNGGDENSVEILHDLEFSQKSDIIKISEDGRYICVSGMYPPQIGLYDTKEMSIKHRRHFDEEVVNFEFLTSNYEKLVFLCKNRYLEFHNAAGKFHKIRIPKEGRSLMYNKNNASVYICASYEDIYVLNLQKGCYDNSICTKNEENNFISKNGHLPIFATGGSNGILEIWDERVTNKSVAFLNVHNSEELTSTAFSDNGLKIAVGTCSGIVKLFDIRHNKPLFLCDHCNDLPIKKIQFLKVNSRGVCAGVSSMSGIGTINGISNASNIGSGSYGEEEVLTQGECIASADANCIKMYAEGRKNILSLQVITFDESKGGTSGRIGKKKIMLLNNDVVNINSFAFYENSGLCFIPCDNKKVCMYFIPFIGIAPKWCNFLDSITEELEEKERYRKDDDITNAGSNDLFDDYVFLTNVQVERLNITHLKGSNNLIPYLHGYYIPSNIYTDIKSAIQDNDLETIKKTMIQKRLQSKQQMRIPERNTLINKDYVEKLLNKVQNKVDKRKKTLVDAQDLLKDDRFSKLFYDPEYMVEAVDLE